MKCKNFTILYFMFFAFSFMKYYKDFYNKLLIKNEEQCVELY